MLVGVPMHQLVVVLLLHQVPAIVPQVVVCRLRRIKYNFFGAFGIHTADAGTSARVVLSR